MVQFSIPMKPFSINKVHYRDKRHKTAEYKQWQEEFFHRLGQIEELNELDRAAKTYKVSLVFHYPEGIFYNSAGKISARTIDLSNAEKQVLDVLFNEFLTIDDRFITVLVSTKIASTNYAITIKIEPQD